MHDLSAEFSKMNSPRVLQVIDGDFIAQVKVSGEFQPKGPATRPGGYPFNGAGLLVWLDAGQFIRLERAAVLQNEKVAPYILLERQEINARPGATAPSLEQGNVYLKMERPGSRISGFYSTDGRKWAEVKPMEVNWPSRLHVGLDAVNTAFSPLSVRFDEFSVRKPDAAPPK